jgi:hypothetical protein
VDLESHRTILGLTNFQLSRRVVKLNKYPSLPDRGRQNKRNGKCCESKDSEIHGRAHVRSYLNDEKDPSGLQKGGVKVMAIP